MNWYKRLKIAMIKLSVRGEFWIMNGQAMGADGDIGDYNHEGMAIESAQIEIMGEEGDWDEWKQNAAKEKFQEAMQLATTPEMQQQVQQKWNADNGDEFLMEELRERGVGNELYQIAEGFGDVRLLAIKLWGWKRLMGNNVETWTLTASDLQEIANGVWDAYQEEAETTQFNIEVKSNSTYYTNVPYDVISSGNFRALTQFQWKGY